MSRFDQALGLNFPPGSTITRAMLRDTAAIQRLNGYRGERAGLPTGWGQRVLVIEHLENPHQVASEHRAADGGGWRTVADLQEAKLERSWHASKRWPEGLTIERALFHPTGVQLERWDDSAAAWIPTTRLSLERV